MPVGPPHILLVDDDPDICLALHDFLTHEGYDVQVARTGKEAVERAQSQQFDAVLLDLGLPDQDGLVVLQILHKMDHKLPIIVLTAFTTTEKTVESLNQGSFAYLTKPYNRNELKAVLERAVGMRHLAAKAERTEHALTESEGRFRALLRSAADAIICADANGHILSWNRAAERMFGYTEEELLGQPLLVIMPLRYREDHRARLEAFRRTGESTVIDRTIEVDGLRRDGSEFPIELSIGTWDTQDGPCFSAIVRDRTDRKRAEETLRRQQIEQQALLDLIPALVWYKDDRNRIIRTNRLAAESIGKTVAEVEGRSTYDLYPHEAEKYYQDDLEVIRSGRPKLGIVEPYQTPSGEKRWVQTDKVPYRDPDGKIIGVLVFAQHMREQYRLLRALAEHIGEVFSLVRPDNGHLLYISPVYEAVWGRSCDSLYADPLSWLDAVHPDDQSRVRAAVNARSSGAAYEMDYRIVRPDGAIRHIRDRAIPVCDETGAVCQIAGIATDVTEMRK
jgi:PAS domain S-box-containing protein